MTNEVPTFQYALIHSTPTLRGYSGRQRCTMDDQASFDINEALKVYLTDPTSIQTPDADPELVDCENDPESLTSQVINGALNPIVDSVAGNPDALTRSAVFDTIQYLLKYAPEFTIMHSIRL